MKTAYQDSRAVPTKALIGRRSLETSFTLSEYLQTGRSFFFSLKYCCILLCKRVALYLSSSFVIVHQSVKIKGFYSRFLK